MRFIVFSLAVLVAACSKTPSEPDAPARSTTEVATVAPLQWDAPGVWAPQPTPRAGPKKASYQTPKTGNDKIGADVEVDFYGTGGAGDENKNFKAWFDQFDGDVGATAIKDSYDVHGFKVETVEVKGTYKIDLSPKMGPQKKSPMQMVRENYRLVGAVVKTPDRGNWFFKMAGPDETVQASKAAFRTMIESAR